SDAAEAWDRTKDSQSIGALEAFIRRFGDTYYGDLAKVRLNELRQAEASRRAEAAASAERERLEKERREAKRLQDEEDRRQQLARRKLEDEQRQRAALPDNGSGRPPRITRSASCPAGSFTCYELCYGRRAYPSQGRTDACMAACNSKGRCVRDNLF